MDWLIHLPVWVQALLATFFTYLMTALGASFVFLSKRLNRKVLNSMQGVAAGIMIAASFFSLLLPAKERLETEGRGVAVVALVLSLGFALGGVFIVLSNFFMSRSKAFSEEKTRGGALTFLR